MSVLTDNLDPPSPATATYLEMINFISVRMADYPKATSLVGSDCVRAGCLDLMLQEVVRERDRLRERLAAVRPTRQPLGAAKRIGPVVKGGKPKTTETR